MCHELNKMVTSEKKLLTDMSANYALVPLNWTKSTGLEVPTKKHYKRYW